MTIRVTVFVEGEVMDWQAVSQGVTYRPVEQAKVNGLHRATFEIEGDEGTIPTLDILVSDGVGVGERLG